jgi:hypothetical protein
MPTLTSANRNSTNSIISAGDVPIQPTAAEVMKNLRLFSWAGATTVTASYVPEASIRISHMKMERSYLPHIIVPKDLIET